MKNIFKVGKVGFLFLATVIFLFTVIPQNASAAIKKIMKLMKNCLKVWEGWIKKL
ncbi:hypothetical protein [Sporosarcina psychrophila]|uniref:Uncharacterized protein n=1 Tax=Sporosarcina psychrophila TaxID=1476 RepID=A0ABV2K249_SPOPS